MHYVYLLESLVDSTWYVGFTPSSPFKRLLAHNSKTVYYSKRKAPWRLIYFEAYLDRGDALGREKFLKSGAGKQFLNKQIKNYLACRVRTQRAIRGPVV